MEGKIRLAVFGQKRLSREGGIEIVVKELCTRMAQNGCEVTCYNRAGHHVSGAEYDKTIEYDGIRQKVVPTIEKKGLAAVSSSFFAALYSAFGRYDVVHIHAEGPAFFCWIPKLFGKRVVNTIHGLDWDREKWRGSVASKFIRGGEKNAVKYADEIIVLSKGVQKYFMDTYGRETHFMQIGVDSEYIVNMGIFSERSDQLTLIPFLEDTKSKVGKYKEIVADAGYESEENYVYLNKQQQDSYIKPSNYEASKKKIKNKYATQNFIYNTDEDTYLCPENQILKPVEIKKSKSKSGYVSEKTIYSCKECENCPYRTLCTQSQTGRRIQRATIFTKFRNESLKNITTEKGILLRMNRSIQVEGAFGVLKQDYGFRRFLTRGNENVKIEMLLLCFAFNINKLHKKTIKKRRNTHLFEKMIA